MAKLTSKENAALNFCLAQAQTSICRRPFVQTEATEKAHASMQEQLDLAKKVVARLRTNKK